MEKLEFGEVAVVDNGKEFIVFKTLEKNNKSYVFLVSNSKPLEVKFATQEIVNGELLLKIVEDQEEKLELMEDFKSSRSL